MPIITLTSDWGNKDYYVAAVKAKIFSLYPQAQIVDISHNVPCFKLSQASFILKSCYKEFPEGSIHIIGVNTEFNANTPHLAVYMNGHYFISSDNGIFSLLFESPPDKIVEIKYNNIDCFTFPARDVLAPAACHIALNNPIEELGFVKDKIKEMFAFQPVVVDNFIRGLVVYIDTYYNAITNISKQLFYDTAKGRNFLIRFVSYSIDKICKTYNEVPESEILAIFSYNGYLQIAQNKGDAANQLGLDIDSSVIVEFDNS